MDLKLKEQRDIAYKWIEKLLKNKVKIAILGSCFSRLSFMSDSYFSGDYSKYFEVGMILYHSSYVSLMANKITYPSGLIQTNHQPNQRSLDVWGKIEFEKSFFDDLGNYKPDFLIIDNFADAVWDLYKIGSSYLTKNYFIGDINIEDFFSDISVIKVDDKQKEELLKNSIKNFSDRILSYIPINRIILVRSHRSTERKINDHVKKWDDYDTICEQNIRWDMVDELLLDNLPIKNIVDMREMKFISSVNHPYGESPSHFESGWYSLEWNKYIDIIIGELFG